MKKKNSGKVRFNIIDFLIILIVLGSIAGVIIRYNIIDRLVLDTDRDSVRISYMVTGVSPQIANSITDGDVYYIVGADNTFGTMEEHSISNALKVEANENGLPVESFDDTMRDVRGTFMSHGVLGDNGFFLDGTVFLAPGKTMVIESKNVRISVIITEIKPYETA